MTIAFDTSALIELERNQPELLKKLRELSETHNEIPCLPFISYFEFIYGLKIKSEQNRLKSLSFINSFQLLSLGRRTAEILSDLKHKYEDIGKSFILADLLIASQAIEHNLTLITKDKQFEGIEELKKIII